jgi:hypothetical protein
MVIPTHLCPLLFPLPFCSPSPYCSPPPSVPPPPFSCPPSSLQANGVSLTCPNSDRVNVVENGVAITRVGCSIGNPLPGPGYTIQVATTLTPRLELIGNEGDISIGLSVTSVNPEESMNTADNERTATLAVVAVADITLDPQGYVCMHACTCMHYLICITA